MSGLSKDFGPCEGLARELGLVGQEVMTNLDCSKEGCRQRVVVVYYVRFTERQQHFDLWPTCLDHQTNIKFNLINGNYSGGVPLLEFHTQFVS